MKNRLLPNPFFLVSVLVLFLITGPQKLLAHCDGLDGPVVKAAQKALETGNVNLVLIWVQPANDPEIKKAFEQAMAERKRNPSAREKGDLRFFDTLVRIHRTGEGEPYTGLKPAGRDLGPVIPAADKAIATGVVDPLMGLLPAQSHATVRGLFKDVMAKKNYDPNDVRAGRGYVKSYVTFLHEAEHIYAKAHGQSKEH